MSNINGKYGYTIQGFLHSQGFDSPHNYLPSAPIKLNLAEAALVPDPTSPSDPDPGRTRLGGDRPIFTAFYPIQKALPYASIVGYYTFTEIGYMIFADEDHPKKHDDHDLFGSVEGWRRINIAGFPGDGSTFSGRYKIDPPPATGDTGVITTQSNGKPNNVWDYTFVRISGNEILLAANGFMPRPGAATGTMKKIS